MIDKVNYPDLVKNALTIRDQLRSAKSPHTQTSDLAWAEVNGSICDEGSPKIWINYLNAMEATKVSSFGSSIPDFDWIGIDEEGRKNAKLINYIWKHWLLKDATQTKLLLALQDSCSGSGFIYEGWYDDGREVKYTEWKGGKSSIKKGKQASYYGPRSYWIPFNNVYLSGNSLEDSDIVIIQRDLSWDDFDGMYGSDPRYTYDKDSVMGVIPVDTESKSGEAKSMIDPDRVEMIEFYKISTNEYILMANKEWINPHDGGIAPNPYPHMQAPISSFVPFVNPYQPYGDTLYKKTYNSRRLVHKLDEVIMMAQQNMMGIIGGDMVDELEMKRNTDTGFLEVHGVSKDNFIYQSPQINLQYALQARNHHINNMIIESGIDFTNLAVIHQYETGTSVLNRKQAFEKRINLAIKQNSMSFFSRWAKQRIANIQGMFDPKKYQKEIGSIGIKGKSLTRIDTSIGEIITESEVDGSTAFSVIATDLTGQFDVFLDADSILGTNRAVQMQETERILSIVMNMRNPDGSPYLSNDKIIKIVDKMMRTANLEEILMEGGVSGGSAFQEDIVGESQDVPQDAIAQRSEYKPQGTLNSFSNQ